MTGDHSKTDLLILGAGWTSTFLIPLCQQRGISFTATSRAGRNGTLPFQFNPDSEDDLSAYEILPHATTVLITFPIEKKGGSGTLVKLYKRTHGGDQAEVRFIQLGTTGIWGVRPHYPLETRHYDRYPKSRDIAKPRLRGMTDTRHLIPITNELWRSRNCWRCRLPFLLPC